MGYQAVLHGEVVGGGGEEYIAGDGISIENGVISAWRTGNPLHNAWFDKDHRINQRNVSGTITTAGYFLDRWILVDGETRLNDDGILLDGILEQRIEFAPGGTPFALAMVGNDIVQGTYETVTGQAYQARVRFTGTGQTFKAANLGSQYWRPGNSPDKALEMLKCQRYQYVYEANNTWITIGSGFAYTNTSARMLIPLPVKIRKNPVLIMTAGNFSDMKLVGGNGQRVNLSESSFTEKVSTPGGLYCTITTSGLTANTSYSLAVSISTLLLDANL